MRASPNRAFPLPSGDRPPREAGRERAVWDTRDGAGRGATPLSPPGERVPRSARRERAVRATTCFAGHGARNPSPKRERAARFAPSRQAATALSRPAPQATLSPEGRGTHVGQPSFEDARDYYLDTLVYICLWCRILLARGSVPVRSSMCKEERRPRPPVCAGHRRSRVPRTRSAPSAMRKRAPALRPLRAGQASSSPRLPQSGWGWRARGEDAVRRGAQPSSQVHQDPERGCPPRIPHQRRPAV